MPLEPGHGVPCLIYALKNHRITEYGPVYSLNNIVLVHNRQSDLLSMFDSIIGYRNQYAKPVLTMTTFESHIGADMYKYPNHRAHPGY